MENFPAGFCWFCRFSDCDSDNSNFIYVFIYSLVSGISWRLGLLFAYGTFFLCGEDGENFCSLTNEQVERYLARFREPEIICDMPDAIICFPCSPQRYRRYMEGLNIGNGLERPDHRDNPSR